MSAIELRNKIIDLLNTDNINYLKEVFEFAEKNKKTDENVVVAYSVEGEALTENEYIQQVKEADVAINTGNYTSVEDLAQEIKRWK